MELFFEVAATVCGLVSVFCFYKAWMILRPKRQSDLTVFVTTRFESVRVNPDGTRTVTSYRDFHHPENVEII